MLEKPSSSLDSLFVSDDIISLQVILFSSFRPSVRNPRTPRVAVLRSVAIYTYQYMAHLRFEIQTVAVILSQT